jgi:glycosyltransferase involved in cell wall biosynthesis
VIVSRFPKLSETFVLQELIGLEERGLELELFAITEESADELQPAAKALDQRANYIAIVSIETVLAQLYWLTKRPVRYVRTWARAMRMSRRPREAWLRAPATIMLAGAMARRMVDHDIERVHAHWATYPTLAAWVVERLADIPYSFTAHAHDITIEASGLERKVRDADLVLTCTDFGRQRVIQRAGSAQSDKVVLIHHGVDLTRFALQPLPGTAGRQLHLLCVAAFHEYKGHRYLLDACRLLVDQGVDVSLELIGDGPLRAELEAYVAELRLADRVVFRGRQSSDSVREATRRSDAAVLAGIQTPDGLMDGIPNVLVEAMAIGRPVVASALPGIRELVIDGETGLLAEPRDPVSLARALTRLLDEPDLAERLVAAGRAKVEAEHDAKVCLDEVYRRLSSLPSSSVAVAGV